MTKSHILIFLLFALLFNVSCNNSDDVTTVSVTLDTVSEGEGIVQTSGNATATISGTMTLNSVSSSVGNDSGWNFASYTLVSDPNGAFITVYWPASEGNDLPNGSYEIGFLDASTDENNTPSGRFVDVSVVVDQTSYSSFLGVSGSATVTNATSDYDMDLVFTANGLEEFFDEVTINAQGALKYRN